MKVNYPRGTTTKMINLDGEDRLVRFSWFMKEKSRVRTEWWRPDDVIFEDSCYAHDVVVMDLEWNKIELGIKIKVNYEKY